MRTDEVADPDADAAPDGEGQHRPEPGATHCADVAAEELHDRGLSGGHDLQCGDDEDEQQDRQPQPAGVVL